MKKALITAMVVFILWNILVYGSFAYIIWQKSSALWSSEQRGGFIFVGILMGLCISCIIYETEPKNNSNH